jgi:hypothetical protein
MTAPACADHVERHCWPPLMPMAMTERRQGDPAKDVFLAGSVRLAEGLTHSAGQNVWA